MKLKTTIYILGVLFLSTFCSCLTNDNSEVIYSSDAQIISFSVANDSIDTSLSTTNFSIDQINNLIYNKDSLNYGISLSKKVVVTYSTSSGLNVLNITKGDSVWVSSGDSIDLKTPVTLRAYAINGDKKEYLVKLNIHTVDPDSIWWKQVNSNLAFLSENETKTILLRGVFYCFSKSDAIKLNTSTDNAVSWMDRGDVNLPLDADLSQIQVQGDSLLFVCTASGDLYKANISDNFNSWQISSDSVKNIFGILPEKEVLTLAVEKGDSIISATFDGKNWEYGDKLPDTFPKSDFSTVSYERTVTDKRLTITGGTSGTSWSTTDGLSWTQIGNLPLNIQGANVFMYDDRFYLLNGNTYNKSVYTSIDGTVTWQLSPSKANLPDNYMSRTGASVVVDSKNIIYIIGGKNGNNPVNDIWRGRINELNQ